MLVLTADHGCDPTAPHTDHTREYAPLLARFAGHGSRRHDGAAGRRRRERAARGWPAAMADRAPGRIVRVTREAGVQDWLEK